MVLVSGVLFMAGRFVARVACARYVTLVCGVCVYICLRVCACAYVCDKLFIIIKAMVSKFMCGMWYGMCGMWYAACTHHDVCGGEFVFYVLLGCLPQAQPSGDDMDVGGGESVFL